MVVRGMASGEDLSLVILVGLAPADDVEEKPRELRRPHGSVLIGPSVRLSAPRDGLSNSSARAKYSVAVARILSAACRSLICERFPCTASPAPANSDSNSGLSSDLGEQPLLN
jgi:hypothetical protein